MILEVEEIHTCYGQSHVLRGVSLSVAPGEVVCLLGRNGAGKTTTLRSIMGLTPPRSGRVRFQGRDIAGWPPFRVARLGVGYVPDDRRIFPDLTAEGNLELARRAGGARPGVWTLARVLELLPVLREVRGRRGRHLSGGEQKMLSIGRALMMNPALFLMDEPAEGLSPLAVGSLIGVIRAIREGGVTILLADQNLKFCRQVAGRAYILEKGAVEHEGALEEIARNPELVRRYLAL